MIKDSFLQSLLVRVLFLCTFLSFGNEKKHFVFVSASYNNEQWCERSLASVFKQQYPYWSMIYINDCSTDRTGELVEQIVARDHMQHKVKIIHNAERMGHCYNQYRAIHSCADDQVIVILDGDDWLAHDRVLQVLNNAYQADVWITYGQFKHAKSGRIGFCREIPQDVLQHNGIRSYKYWITSHMRTFYSGLYKKIKIDDLMFEGKFLPVAVDHATMFAMLEMAGPHYKYISEILYIYNDMNPISFYRQNPRLQGKIMQMIRSYTPYEPLKNRPW